MRKFQKMVIKSEENKCKKTIIKNFKVYDILNNE